jgi:hypothetical protein
MKISFLIISLALLASCKKTAPESLKTASDNAVLTEFGFENRITYVSNELLLFYTFFDKAVFRFLTRAFVSIK